MATVEQVERLRQYADISFEEARDALDASNGNLLDAIVLLERQGKIKSGKGASGGPVRVIPENEQKKESARRNAPGESGDFFQRLGELFEQSLRTMFIAYNPKTNNDLFSMPALVLIVLAVFAFWVALPLLLIGLICGLRYRFESPDIKVDKVNKILDDVGDASDAVKDEVRRGFAGDKDEAPKRVDVKPSDISDMPEVPEAPKAPEVIDVDYTPVIPPEPPSVSSFRTPEQL